MQPSEPATNDVSAYRVKKAVENLPKLRDRLSAVCDNYLIVQQDILESFIDRGQLHNLTQPTVLPSGRRIPGLKLDHPRQLALMHALVRFAHIAAGSTFTTAEPSADAGARLAAFLIADKAEEKVSRRRKTSCGQQSCRCQR